MPITVGQSSSVGLLESYPPFSLDAVGSVRPPIDFSTFATAPAAAPIVSSSSSKQYPAKEAMERKKLEEMEEREKQILILKQMMRRDRVWVRAIEKKEATKNLSNISNNL